MDTMPPSEGGDDGSIPSGSTDEPGRGWCFRARLGGVRDGIENLVRISQAFLCEEKIHKVY
ncbi:MAG: hypothetical protein JWN18_716 [Parcubacteria group bacterium]|nr:hypothetical protein [Parcubacteria group bacterium]